jgi:hypothetical protein
VRGIEFKQMANGRIVGTDAPLPPDIPAHREIRDHAVDFPDDGVRSLHGRRQHVSREILDDQLIDSLAPYRPTRFAR